jgi:hypothetical protein
MKIRLGPQLLASILISFLVIFLLVQLWYLYAETENTKEAIQRISQTYDQRIKQTGVLGTLTPQARQNEIAKLSFLKEFRNQKEWERSHERVNRRYSTFISLSEWFLALFILWLTVLNERESTVVAQPEPGSGQRGGVPNLLVFFAALAIAFPAITQKLGFEVRQEIHDYRAHQLEMLIVELEAGVTGPREAWQRYQALYGESVNSYINKISQ